MSRHAGGRAHTLLHEVVERHAARPLGDQGQHDEAAVAVREPLAGREHGRVAVEHGEVLLGRRELVHGNRHHVVGDLDARRPRRGSRRCPTGAPAGARRSRRRRSAAGRRRAPSGPWSRARASPPRSGSRPPAPSGPSRRWRCRTACRACSGSRGRGRPARTPSRTRSYRRGRRAPRRRKRCPRRARRSRRRVLPSCGRYRGSCEGPAAAGRSYGAMLWLRWKTLSGS